VPAARVGHVHAVQLLHQGSNRTLQRCHRRPATKLDQYGNRNAPTSISHEAVLGCSKSVLSSHQSNPPLALVAQ
jgi:hypothetical protein